MTSSGSKFFAAAAKLIGLSKAELKEARLKLARFEKFCDLIETEDKQPFKLERWQKLVLLAYFAGIAELLVIIPKGNGKTTLFAALAVFHLLTTTRPEVYIGASTTSQAAVMYDEASRISQLRPAWRKKLIPRQSTKYIYVGRGGKDGFLRVLSSDRLGGKKEEDGSGALEGIKPSLGLIDELHAHINDAIVSAIQGALHKRKGQMVIISTAGVEQSPLKRIRDKALEFPDIKIRDRLTIARSKASAMFEWALTKEDDPEDIKLVKRVNPSSFISVGDLKDIRESPTMTPTRWARRHCNLWIGHEGGWLDSTMFDATANPDIVIPGDEPIVLGYDHARSYDHAALVAVRPVGRDGEFVPMADYDPEKHGGGRAQVAVIAHLEPGEQDGGRVPFWKIKQAIRDANESYTVAAVGFDKLGGFAQSAEELADEGIPMVSVSMASDVWGPLSAEMYAAVKSGRLEHLPHPALREHFLAGELKDSPHGERLHGRMRSGQKVDLLIASGIAWYTAFFDSEAFQATSPAPEDFVGYRLQHV